MEPIPVVDSKTHGRRRRVAAIVCASLISVAAAALAQREFGDSGFQRGRLQVQPNIPYDGRFTFVRISYETAPGGYWAGGRPSWAHGYPLAERNLMKIMNEVSYLGAHDEEINTVTLDDPQLARYPVAYIIEVGWWTLTDREAAALRAYILKGGFVIVDDFKLPGWRGIEGGGWEPFAENMKRVLPEARFVEMQATHPIFHAFFEINELDNFPQAYNSGQPIFRGIFEDNDPNKRLQVIVNYNTDISQYWEWSGRGFRPFDQTNEAYKLGVNYLIYGLTH
ncbi:MAG TPA: DUF4159 domain-containing protein [Vicinamibacterales bacterium]|nr:DUF4159 domain-containing protein [Vicinamibacterales bacterium]